jgi:hypothetical protein
LGDLAVDAPENELPVSVPVDLQLVRTGDLVVTLTGVQAYRSGVAFLLNARRRGGAPLPATLHLMYGADPGRQGAMLLQGLQFPDGRTVTNVNLGRWRPRSEPYPDAPVLSTSGASGTDRNVNARLFLTPVPPAGTMTVYAAWPCMHIAEVSCELDATPIAEASSRAIQLWPDEPHHEPAPGQPGRSVDLKPGGWFDQMLRPIEPGEGWKA